MYSQLLIALTMALVGVDDFYMYPDKYEHGDGLEATVNDEALAALVQSWTHEYAGDRGKPEVKHRIDLNNDGKAELLLYPPAIFMGTGGPWYEIFTEINGEYVPIGQTGMGSEMARLGASRNGFARLLMYNYRGHRTNPIYVVDVYAYDGKEYICEYASTLSSGQREENGIEAYRAGDYATAEKWFVGLNRAGKYTSLSATNNLALVYFKTGRYQEIVESLSTAIADAETLNREYPPDAERRAEQRKHRANAYYNLGKACEALEDMPSAAKYYRAAYELVPTDARKETVDRMESLGVGSVGFKLIR